MVGANIAEVQCRLLSPEKCAVNRGRRAGRGAPGRQKVLRCTGDGRTDGKNGGRACAVLVRSCQLRTGGARMRKPNGRRVSNLRHIQPSTHTNTTLRLYISKQISRCARAIMQFGERTEKVPREAWRPHLSTLYMDCTYRTTYCTTRKYQPGI